MGKSLDTGAILSRVKQAVGGHWLQVHPGMCAECAPRRACERRAAAASWQVALAAAKFAGPLLILDSTYGF